MKEILVSSHNMHKIKEIQQILPGFKITSLNDYGIFEEILEDGSSFEENSYIKAKYCFEKTGKSCLGDDSGLVIPALGGRPGIFSARYTEDRNFDASVAKVLHEMENIDDRRAYFITVLCFFHKKSVDYFEGRIYGKISLGTNGKKGFGYDPIFIPDGFEISFAEMDSQEKNKISHRFIALNKFLDFLQDFE